MSTPLMILIIVLSNLVVGTLIGISGIAGFLLPLIYVSVLNIPLRDSLAISFLSFLVGGMFGTYSYWKLGNIDFKFAKLLSIGSIIGAIVGVRLNMMIPVNTAKLLLYIVVLLSGISILLRKNSDAQNVEESNKTKILENQIFVIAIGFITATICALTGAGGPILVVPVLTILGMNIKVAVGVAILNQIIIALPSALGYFSQSDFRGMIVFIISSLIAHVIGILIGARISDKINVNVLKKIVSTLSISSALYMIIATFIS